MGAAPTKIEPVPDPTMVEMVFGDKPTPFIVCTVMWFLHGFMLDIFIIGVLPIITGEKTSSGMFYDAKGASLAPQHRRFIAENTAYAVMRLAPIFFTKNMPVLLINVVSYFVEGFTVCRELIKYNAPSDAFGPQTLLSIFASIVTYAVTTNPDGYVKEVDPTLLMMMQGFCGLTWACWVTAVVGTKLVKTD